jgi:hypothetical protein
MGLSGWGARGRRGRGARVAPARQSDAAQVVRRLGAEAALDVVLDDLVELLRDALAAQRQAFSPSMKTGAAGASPVPGRLMPMSACLLSPGPLTMQPITATLRFSTPG